VDDAFVGGGPATSVTEKPSLWEWSNDYSTTKDKDMGNITCLVPADSPTVYPATMRYAASRVRNINPRSPPSV